jgi:CBS domain containing-hemolysin-like protein
MSLPSKSQPCSPGTANGADAGTIQASYRDAVHHGLPIEPALDPSERTTAVVVLVVAVTIALVTSFVCSISEAVLLSVNRSHVEKMAKSGSRAGAILKRWKKHDIETPIAALLILHTFAHTVGATFAGSAYQSLWPGSLAFFSVIFTLAVLIFTEIIPKTLGVAYADRLAAPVTLLFHVVSIVLHWPLRFTGFVARLVTGDRREPVTSVEEIRLLAAVGSREGALGPRFADFIEGIASLIELTARDVMVPRGGVAYLSGERTLTENLATIKEFGHSRFLFTPTGELDDVDGVILAKDLLFAREGEIRWDEIKHPLLVVPESKPLDQTLRLFQEERKHLAVVVDEYGGTQGVITLEDVLEEIVGEIEDETDAIEKMIVKRPDGVLVCRGRAEMRKLLRVVNIDERVEVVTVAGFVAELLTRVPIVGDAAEWKNLRFKVTKANRRRAERVEVEVLPEGTEA